jgi:hypothetical protein
MRSGDPPRPETGRRAARRRRFSRPRLRRAACRRPGHRRHAHPDRARRRSPPLLTAPAGPAAHEETFGPIPRNRAGGPRAGDGNRTRVADSEDRPSAVAAERRPGVPACPITRPPPPAPPSRSGHGRPHCDPQRHRGDRYGCVRERCREDHGDGNDRDPVRRHHDPSVRGPTAGRSWAPTTRCRGRRPGR